MSLYQPLGSYLTTGSAVSLYQPLGNYLTTGSAVSLYQPLGSYLTSGSASVGHLNLSATGGRLTLSGSITASDVGAAPAFWLGPSLLLSSNTITVVTGTDANHPAAGNDPRFGAAVTSATSTAIGHLAVGVSAGQLTLSGSMTASDVGAAPMFQLGPSLLLSSNTITVVTGTDGNHPAAGNDARFAAALVSATSSYVFYVDVNGNDLTALPGDPKRPFATWLAGYYAAAAYSVAHGNCDVTLRGGVITASQGGGIEIGTAWNTHVILSGISPELTHIAIIYTYSNNGTDGSPGQDEQVAYGVVNGVNCGGIPIGTGYSVGNYAIYDTSTGANHAYITVTAVDENGGITDWGWNDSDPNAGGYTDGTYYASGGNNDAYFSTTTSTVVLSNASAGSDGTAGTAAGDIYIISDGRVDLGTIQSIGGTGGSGGNGGNGSINGNGYPGNAGASGAAGNITLVRCSVLQTSGGQSVYTQGGRAGTGLLGPGSSSPGGTVTYIDCTIAGPSLSKGGDQVVQLGGATNAGNGGDFYIYTSRVEAIDSEAGGGANDVSAGAGNVFIKSSLCGNNTAFEVTCNRGYIMDCVLKGVTFTLGMPVDVTADGGSVTTGPNFSGYGTSSNGAQTTNRILNY